MANVVGSFAGGIDIGRGLLDIANQKEDRELRLRDREENRDYLMKQREREDQRWTMGLEDRQRRIAKEERLDKERKEDRERTKLVRSREDVKWKQSQERYNHEQVLQKRKEGLETVYYPAMQRYIATGDVSVFNTPEFQKFSKENPMLSPFKAADDGVQTALTTAEGLLSRAANGESFDPYDTELSATVETLFPEITQASTLPTVYTDKDGKEHQITERKIAGVHMMPNGNIALEQQLTLSDGNTVNVPITENRSSEPGDPVRQITVQDLTDRMMQTRQFRDVISRGDANSLMYLNGKKSLNQQGDAFTAPSGKSSSKTATTLKKEQLAAAAKIDERFDKEIADMSAMTQDPKAREQQVLEIEKRRAKAHERNNMLYSQETGFDYNQNGSEANDKLANRKLRLFTDSYQDYEFPAVVKSDILDMLRDGLAPDQVDEFIQANIKDGTIRARSSNPTNKMEEIRRRSAGKHDDGKNEQGLDIASDVTPSQNGNLPKYGGEFGAALPGYERGEGLSSYFSRQYDGAVNAGRTFSDWANEKQAQLQHSLSSD